LQVGSVQEKVFIALEEASRRGGITILGLIGVMVGTGLFSVKEGNP